MREVRGGLCGFSGVLGSSLSKGYDLISTARALHCPDQPNRTGTRSPNTRAVVTRGAANESLKLTGFLRAPLLRVVPGSLGAPLCNPSFLRDVSPGPPVNWNSHDLT